MKLSKVILFITCYCLFRMVNGQQIDWKKSYGSNSEDAIESIVKIGQNYYTSGPSSSDSGLMLMLKLNYSGDSLFKKNDTFYRSWTVDGDKTSSNELFFLGRRYSAPNYTSTLVTKVDTSGNFKWTKEYNTTTTANVRSIVSLPDGGAIHIGERGDFSTMVDFYAIRIDSGGNVVWDITYFKGGYQTANHIALLNDGSLLLSGYQFLGTRKNIFYLQIDQDGNEIASDTIITGIDDGDYVKGLITKAKNGDYLITTSNELNDNASLFRTDSNFNYLWHYSRANYRFFEPYEMQDGTILIGGQSDIIRNGTIIKLEANGTFIKEVKATNPTNDNSAFNDIAFDGKGGAVAAGWIDYFGTPARDDFYYVKYDSVGIPVPSNFGCDAPVIHWITADVVGQSFINLADSATEYIKYSSILVHDWYFMDGGHVQGQFNSYSFNNTLYPDSFWCQLVVTDGVGCTDTMTIDAYTGEIIYPNPTYEPPLGTKETLRSAQRDVRVYPNPFTDQFVVHLPSLLQRPHIRVMDMLGKQMNIEYSIMKEGVVINGSSLPKGMYILDIQGYGQTKIVKR